MTKFFLASHGHFASGLKSSLEILTGENNRLTVFDAYINEDSLEEALKSFFSGLGEEDSVIMLSDIYGGSVNSVMYTFLNRPNTRLIAGVNLPLTIALMLEGDDLSDDTLEQLVEESRETMRIVTLETGEENETEETLF